MPYDFYFVALGNPGSRYHLSRHNTGFLLADRLLKSAPDARRLKALFPEGLVHCWQALFYDKKTLVAKPQTYLNRSGEAVRALLKKFPIDASRQLYVAYDDLDIPLGSVRLRKKGSAGTHKGMASVVDAVGNGNFPRLRLGIGPKPPHLKAEDFVLDSFRKEERPLVEVMLSKAEQLWNLVVCEGLEMAVSKYQ